MSNGRVMGTYLNSIDIVDREMKSVMHYEKPGSWIREVSVDDSRIHMKTVNSRDGFFGAYSEDTLVCNAEILPGKTDDIGWYASDQKGQIMFVQLDRDVDASKKKNPARHLRSLRRAVRQSNRSQRQLVRLRNFMRMDEDDSSDVLWTLPMRRRQHTIIWDS